MNHEFLHRETDCFDTTTPKAEYEEMQYALYEDKHSEPAAGSIEHTDDAAILPENKELSTHEAVARAVEVQDFEKIGQLFASHVAPDFNNSLARYAPNPQDREDILQETFIKIMLKIHQFNPKEEVTLAAFRAWAYSIAHNLTIDKLRKEARHPKQVLDITEVAESVPDPSPTIPDIFIKQRKFTALYKTISSPELSDREQYILQSLLDEKSYGEIGQELAIPQTTLKPAIHRSKAHARTLLQKELE